MSRRFWVPIFAAALALLFAAGNYAPTTVHAASKQEQMLQELQRDVAQLQETVKTLQRSQDDKFSALQVLVQQSFNMANEANKSIAVIQSNLQQSVRDQESKLLPPVAQLSGRMDSMSENFRSLQNAMSDLTVVINRMQTQLTEVKDALKVMQAPPAAPPPQAPPATDGGAAPAAVSAAPLPASDLYTNAVRDQEGKHFDLALQEYTDYLKYYGNTAQAPDAQFYIGLIHYNQGNYETAAQDFDLLLEKYPTDNRRVPQAFFYKGKSLKEMNQKTKAGEEFKQLIADYPNHDLAKQACAELQGMGLRCSVPKASAPAKTTAKRPAKK
jgi:TolA-binding protein